MATAVWHTRYNLNSRLKATFKRKLLTYGKKNPNISPVSLKTKELAVNWWGKAWNANLKNYTNNNMQLEKGKLNFKCDALADCKITANTVEAIVLGSKIKPNNVKISFKLISQEKWQKIQEMHDGHLEAFEKILDNQFPKEMVDVFTDKQVGLFPPKDEISFSCSCSDRINICKHIAVVLFALGTLIDEDIHLLFKLRGVNVLDFISKSIHEQRKSLLEKAKNKSIKIIKDTNLSELFSINIKQDLD